MKGSFLLPTSLENSILAIQGIQKYFTLFETSKLIQKLIQNLFNTYHDTTTLFPPLFNMDSGKKQRSAAEIFQGFKEGETELRKILRGFPGTSEDLKLDLDAVKLQFEEAEKTFHREGISEASNPSSRTEASLLLHRYWPTPPNLWILILTVGLLFFGSTAFMTIVLNVPKLLEMRTTKGEIGKLKLDEISEISGQSLLLTLALVFALFFIYIATYWTAWGFFFLFFFGPRKQVRGCLKKYERRVVRDPERLPKINNGEHMKAENDNGQHMEVVRNDDQHVEADNANGHAEVVNSNDQNVDVMNAPHNSNDYQGER
jgi:hypothetical protein